MDAKLKLDLDQTILPFTDRKDLLPMHIVHLSPEIKMNSNLGLISICLSHLHGNATFPDVLFIELSIAIIIGLDG